MRTLFKIKWENILTLLMLAATIDSWFMYFKVATETKMLAVACITTFLYLFLLFSYKTIFTFRKQVLKFW